LIETRNASGQLQSRSRNRPNGFTLIELVVVIVVISVLGVVATDRFLYYHELAEKAAMDAMLSSIKMGLQIRMAVLTASNRRDIATALERENPLRWLESLPANYEGEYRAPLERGTWYFASDARELVYVPSHTTYLHWQKPGGKRELRFAARLRYDDPETTTANARVPTGVSIRPVNAYRWF
jgi:prepilin-type N-terminal cleavage/methylation domain-containing protein